MAENIGEATVKINADISQLEQKVQEVKGDISGLGNFKVNAEGFSGTLEEYNKWLEEANNNVQTHEEYLAGVNRVMEELHQHMQEFPAPIQQVADNVSDVNAQVDKQIGFFENLKDRLVQVGDMAEGSFLRTKETIQNVDRVGRTALIGLATAITAFAKKSIDEYAKYNEAFAQSQEQTEKAMSKLKATIGSLLAPIVTLLGGFAQWISENQQLVAGLFTTVSIIGGAAGIIALVRKLTGALAALKVTAGGIVGIIAVIAGAIVGMNTQTQDLTINTEELEEEQEKQKEQLKELEKGYNSYGGAVDDAADRIAEIRAQMEKTTQQYRQNLKQILVNHEDTVAKLTDQIRNANVDYQRAIDERVAAFNVSQAEEEREHQEKVDALMTQINFLQRYNNQYNREKLSQLQFALAKENSLYQRRTDAEKAELDIQLANEKAKYDEKIAAYQEELDSELAFLNKHRDLLNGVRDEILEDEVESLTRQYNEQMANYQKQIENARESGAAAASKYANAYSDMMESLTPKLTQTGKDAGDAFGGGFFAGVGRLVDNVFDWIGDQIDRMIYRSKRSMKDMVKEYEDWFKAIEEGHGYNYDEGRRGYAEGGFTGRGGVNEIAGVVHKGEYVLPQSMVDQNTGQPKALGNNITINVSGTFATSAIERRKVAQDIVSALGQTQYARLGA